MGVYNGRNSDFSGCFCANNLKNITVSFNKEVNEDTVTSSNVKVYDGTNVVTGVELNLLEDNKTLLITNNGTYTQNKSYRVVVENVEEKEAETKVVSYDSSVTVLDTTLPTVESVNVLSPKTVEILFSEPIQTGSGAGQFPTSAGVLTDIVQVNGINLYATPDVDSVVTGNKVTLTLNTALTAGSHKVKVNNLNDYANLPITAKEFDVTVAEDNVAPEALSVTVLNKDKVKVTFNEPVDNATVQANLANIKVNGTAVNSATAKDGGVSYELALGSSLTLAAVVEAEFSYKGVKDNYGNEVTTAKTLKFTAQDDTTAPVVTNTEVKNDNTVEVTFSEDVTNFTGTSSVELYDKDNKKLSNTVTVTKKVIKGVASDKVYVVTVTGGSSLSGAHSLKILKDTVTDLSIRTNKFAETTLPVVLKDKVAPTIAKAEFVNETSGTDFNSDGDVKDSKLTIYFDEAMDAATLTNKSNYLVGGTPLSDVTGTVTLTAASDNKSVTITVNRASTADQLVFATSSDVRVIAVKDAAGNTLDSAHVNANLGSGGLGLISQFTSAPTLANVIDLAKVEAVARNQVKVYATGGYTLTGIDPNKVKFAYTADDSAISTLQVTSVAVAADGKSAVLTLNSNLTADAKFGGTPATIQLYADANAVTLSNGAKSAALAADATTATVLDKIKTSLAATNAITLKDATTDTLEVTFNEVIQFNSSIANDLVVKVNGEALDFVAGDFTVADGTGADAKFEIKIVKDGVENATNVTVELVSGRYLLDAADNRANTFAATTITLATGAVVTEQTAPDALIADNVTMGATGFTGTSTATGKTIKVVADEGTAASDAVATATVAADGTFTITGLTASTSYEVFVIDSVGNASAAYGITTSAAQ